MGNQHGHSLKERVVALAKEEEARRRAHFQRETKARKAPAGVKVDADKTVLFDFEASRDFAEQLSVRRDEVVHVLENCGDGWSQISNSKQKRGVVPTSYLGPVIDKSKGSSFRQTADQRLQVLKEMAVSQASDKAWGLVGLCVWGVGALASNVLLPGADKLYRFFSRSESYTSLLAGGVRNVFAVIMGSLIPVLADEELIEANSVLSETSVRLKEEKARRLAVAAAASATHSATTPPLAGS